MKTFAKIQNNIVVNVIIADEDFILSQENPSSFVEYDAENVASINGSYNDGVFLKPKPFLSFILDSNYNWQPPTPKPEGNVYWDESSLSWLPIPDAG